MAGKRLATFCLAAIIATGCAANRVTLDAHDGRVDSEILVRSIGYDDNGLPVPDEPIDKRPARPGDHFTVVRLSGKRLVSSYDIAVVREKPDFGKPFLVVYEWTGKGFNFGAEASAVLAQGLRAGTYRNEEAIAALAIVATPVAAGTVGGFIVGVVDGIKQTAIELGKVVLDANEQVVSCTTYHYDSRDRLVLMRMLSPDRTQEFVRTEFLYEGAGTVPARTVVKSRVEEKERNIE